MGWDGKSVIEPVQWKAEMIGINWSPMSYDEALQGKMIYMWIQEFSKRLLWIFDEVYEDFWSATHILPLESYS